MAPKKKTHDGLPILPDGVDPASGTFPPPAMRRRLDASTPTCQQVHVGSMTGPIRVPIGRKMPPAANGEYIHLAAASPSAQLHSSSSSVGHHAGDQASSSAARAIPGKASGKGGNATAIRKDMPVVKHTARGSIHQALASGRPENREETMANYQKDKFTSQGATARDALWSSWRRLHLNWFGFSVAVLPLTVIGIAAVLAQLKGGGYRSAANYMSRAKYEHLKLQHVWSDQLAQEANEGVRSTMRGTGPGHQSAEFPVMKLLDVDIPDISLEGDFSTPLGVD